MYSHVGSSREKQTLRKIDEGPKCVTVLYGSRMLTLMEQKTIKMHQCQLTNEYVSAPNPDK